VPLSTAISGTIRARARGAALLMAGTGALALPASAAALATSVVGASVAGPNAAMTEGDSAVSCGSRLVSGGGARTDQPVLSNGTHLAGSFPTPDGIGQAADGDVSPTTWIGAGAIGGQATSGVTTWAYGICLDAGPAATRVVVSSKPGPSGTFTGVLATATCPAGTRLLSGGARTTPGTIGSLKPNGSYPSDASGAPVVSGTNPTSWTAAGLNGGAGDTNNTTHAFAICANAGAANPTVTVQNARVDGPGDASTGGQVTTTCPGGTVLLGGGGYISDHFALPGSQGDHLTGSFPSDANGAPVTSGPAGSWTASSHIGGTVSGPQTDTNVWALCASEPGAAGEPGSPGGPGSAGPPVVAPSGPVSGGVTVAQLRASLHRQMTPQGNAAKIATMRRRGGAALPFKALDAGRVVIRWYQTVPATPPQRRKGHRTRLVLFAQGRQTFQRSGAKTVTMRLTAAGRRGLAHATRVKLTAKGTFTRATGKPIADSRNFVLTRHAASTTP
jgi:hypothetical protein